jgi:hypothetical protein
MGISSVTGSNTWTVTCKDYSGNTGTDSVTFNVILPPVDPFCGDGTCNGNETCSTCPTDCGVCPTTCDLTQAYWSVSNTLNGQVVSLNVKGTNCDGKTILFKVWNDKTGSSDLYVTDTATDIMENGFANSAWVAIAPYDGDSTPEYYFIASILGGTENIKSGNLLVTKPTDTTKPIVDVTYPTATTYTSQRTNLIFSVSDDNLKSCTYSLNGASPVNVASLVNGVNTITGISSVTGSNTWTVTCKDYSGNTGTDSVNFNVVLPTPPFCGDGTCNGNETCSTCPTDCGVCPTNCTICKDSKPLDDSNYDYLAYLNKKTTFIFEEASTKNVEKEKSLLKDSPILISLILILGILMLLIVIAIARIIKRKN